MLQNPLLIILGPTASGKTRLAVNLAAELDGEIISADSRQVYRGMDIGTGKDLSEYQYAGQVIPYHLIDIRKPGEKYNVNEFKEGFFEVFEDISARKRLPILCGGTGMYIHSLLQQQDHTAIPADESLRARLAHCDIQQLRSLLLEYPDELVRKADQSSHKRLIRAIEIGEFLKVHPLMIKERPVFNPVVIGLTSDIELRKKRIYERLEARLDAGLITEVKILLENGVPRETLEYYGLEYKFVSWHLHNELTLAQLKEKLLTAIYQFAKRQMTFFRKMEKDGVVIHWFETHQDLEAVKYRIVKVIDP